MDPTKNWAYVDFYYADLHLPEIGVFFEYFLPDVGEINVITEGKQKI